MTSTVGGTLLISTHCSCRSFQQETLYREPLFCFLLLLLRWIHLLSQTQSFFRVRLRLCLPFYHFKAFHLLQKHNDGLIIYFLVIYLKLLAVISRNNSLFLTVSMSFRFSTSCRLSLISFDATHDLIWSRSLCERDVEGQNEPQTHTQWFRPAF